MSSVVRTQSDVSTALSFCSSAGTDVVLTSSDVVRGSSGSPVIATSLPAMNIGRISSFAGVTSSLGNLSGPSVTFPEFVSKEFLDGALKAVFIRLERIEERDAERQRELDELRCLSKGKSVATESEPPVPSTTPAVTSPLRLARPPATSLPTIPGYVREDEFDASLLSFSKQVYKLEETVRDRDAQIEMLYARIRDLEATCRTQSQLPKRCHDDPDGSDRHEGEEPAARDFILISLPPQPQPQLPRHQQRQLTRDPLLNKRTPWVI